MTDPRPDAPQPARSGVSTSIGEVVELVKTYAKQETVGPVRGAGRWLGRGLAGAALLGLGGVLVLLGVLRLVQTEWDRSARGSLSWLAYAIVLALAAGLIALTLSRIKRTSLDNDQQ